MRRLLSDTGLIFGRSLRQTLRAKVGVLFAMLQPVLFLAFFGPLLGRLDLGTRGDSWQVLVPGLLLQLGLFSSGFAGFALVFDKRNGVIERMQVTPVSRLALILGRVLRDMVQLLAQSVLLVLIAVAFGLRAPLLGILVGFAFVALLAAALSSLSYALGMRANSVQEFAPVVNAITMPMILLSGLLLPMALAPLWLDVVSHFVPFRYIVDAVRAAFVGDYVSPEVGLGALVSVAFAAVAMAIGTRLFARAGA